MSLRKKLILLAIAILILMAALKFFPYRLKSGENLALGEAAIAGNIIDVEVADTPAKQEQGLSGRASLPEGQGMLFVFYKPGNYGFWMKDMKFPIDIIWINSEKRVIGVEKDTLPSTYPEVFRPNEAIKYVLEVPAGFAQRHSVDIGQEVYFAF